MDLPGLIAREHLRVSKDKSGRERSITDQRADNQQWASEQGWTLAEPFNDGTVSAHRKSKRRREGFHKLITSLEDGTFGADILIMWANDRNARSAAEGNLIIDGAEEAGVLIAVTTHRKVYDPANPRDRKSLQEDYIDAEYDNAKRSLAVKRGIDSTIEQGGWTGSPPYGMRSKGIRKPSKMTGVEVSSMEPHPEQAPIVVEVVDRLIKGELIYHIANDMNARKIESQTGTRWTSVTVNQVARNRAVAGFASRPDIIPSWEAIISREKHEMVIAILDGRVRYSNVDPKRRGGRKTTKLLAKMLKCAKCGVSLPMTNSDTYYYCRSQQKGGCYSNSIRRDRIEPFVRDEILDHIAYEGALDVLWADAAQEDSQVESLTQRREALNRRKARVDAQVNDPTSDYFEDHDWERRQNREIKARQAKLDLEFKQYRETARGLQFQELQGISRTKMLHVWERQTVTWRRDLINYLVKGYIYVSQGKGVERTDKCIYFGQPDKPGARTKGCTNNGEAHTSGMCKKHYTIERRKKTWRPMSQKERVAEMFPVQERVAIDYYGSDGRREET